MTERQQNIGNTMSFEEFLDYLPTSGSRWKFKKDVVRESIETYHHQCNGIANTNVSRVDRETHYYCNIVMTVQQVTKSVDPVNGEVISMEVEYLGELDGLKANQLMKVELMRFLQIFERTK